jgi:prepilin-type N-terminal cleavage/methylation domain-containing protein
MKKKKGFTLVELLSVIVVLAIIVLAAIPAVIAISKSIRANMYCSKIDILKKAGVMYAQENTSLLTETCTINSNTYSCKNITVGTLITEGFVDPNSGTNLTDPRDNSSMNSKTVIVYQKGARYYTKIDATECD